MRGEEKWWEGEQHGHKPSNTPARLLPLRLRASRGRSGETGTSHMTLTAPSEQNQLVLR